MASSWQNLGKATKQLDMVLARIPWFRILRSASKERMSMLTFHWLTIDPKIEWVQQNSGSLKDMHQNKAYIKKQFYSVLLLVYPFIH